MMGWVIFIVMVAGAVALAYVIVRPRPRPRPTDIDYRIVTNGEAFKVQRKTRGSQWSDCYTTRHYMHAGEGRTFFDSESAAKTFMEHMQAEDRRVFGNWRPV